MNEVMNLKRLCTGVRAQQDGSTTYWYQTPLRKPWYQTPAIESPSIESAHRHQLRVSL